MCLCSALCSWPFGFLHSQRLWKQSEPEIAFWWGILRTSLPCGEGLGVPVCLWSGMSAGCGRYPGTFILQLGVVGTWEVFWAASAEWWHWGLHCPHEAPSGLSGPGAPALGGCGAVGAVQRRAVRMSWGLEHLSNEEKLILTNMDKSITAQ